MTVLRPHPPRPVALADLDLGASPATVTGITQDSRLVQPGDLYAALPGARHHGADFIADATAAGAAAVLTDLRGATLLAGSSLPVVVAADPRGELSRLAARIYRVPAEAMRMLALTGTNGKTTTAYLVEAALRTLGLHTGLIGTLGYALDGRPLAGARTTITTPESTELHGLLGYLRDEHADAVVMEVSSHALALGRADEISFDVAGFTNLGRDHLDFHGDLESYFEAKASLFTAARTRHAVVNVDDPRGAQLARRIEAREPVGLSTVSLRPGNPAGADCTALGYAAAADGTIAVSAQIHGRDLDFRLSLPGHYNVCNALIALAMIDAAGLDPHEAATGLATAVVPGRMQRVPLGPGAPRAYVDFAHTPQAVAASLTALDPQARRIVVLGCGGDRDPSKRGPVGAAAAGAADVVIVTDDNPRSEPPTLIRQAILAGAQHASPKRATEVVDGGDRRSAIALALTMARPDDVVAVLGKGHETTQETAGQVSEFSDPQVLAEVWAGLGR